MALSTATVTFDLADHLGVDFDVRRTRLWVTTNVPDDTVADGEAHQIRLGSGQIVLNSDGTGSFTTWVGEEGVSNPASWQTTLHVDYIDGGRHERKRKSFGPYTITADAYLDDLMDEQEIPPTYASAFTASMEEIRDESAANLAQQVELSGIDDTDSAVGALMGNEGVGPLTRAATRELVADDLADSGSDIGSALSASLDEAVGAEETRALAAEADLQVQIDGWSTFGILKGDWTATAYDAGDIVNHSGSIWGATTAATSGDEPGVAALWQELPATVDAQARTGVADLDVRAPIVDRADKWQIKDITGRVAFTVDEHGDTTPHGTLHLGGADSLPDGYAGQRWRDSEGNIVLDITPEGRVQVFGPLDLAHPVYDLGIQKVILSVGVGQSNMVARVMPLNSRIDPARRDILQWNWSTQNLQPLAAPMSQQNNFEYQSPLNLIAREQAAYFGPTVKIATINCAVGGTGLVADSANGVWSTTYAGANPALYPIATAEITKAVNALKARYPGIPVEVWFFWHQGEQDRNTTQSAYETALDALIAGFRSTVGDSTAPWAMGGYAPQVSYADELVGVRRALAGTPARVQHTAYTPGIENAGNSGAVDDSAHYARTEAERLARNMWEAARRATVNDDTSNVTGKIPHCPLTVSGTYVSGTLTARWEFPMCRLTAFVVEYRIDGGSWTTATLDSPLDTTVTVTGLSGSHVEVRVAGQNGAVTSVYSQPVYALTA